jgi:AcrR family transcriptional regulator
LPTERRTQAERREATRKLILDATVEAMMKLGIAGLRMEDVEQQAGVSRGALLHHFATKQDMIYATLEYVNERSLERSRERTQFALRARSIAEVIDAVVADATEFFFGQGFFVEFSLAFQQALPDLRRATNRLSRTSRFAVEESWREALESQGLPSDIASDVLDLTLNAVRGFFVRRFLDDDRSRRAHLMKVWQDMVRYYLVNRLGEERLTKVVPGREASTGLVTRPAAPIAVTGPSGARKGSKTSARSRKKGS